MTSDSKQENPANPYWKYVISKVGRITVDKPGKYNLSLKPQLIRGGKNLGLNRGLGGA